MSAPRETVVYAMAVSVIAVSLVASFGATHAREEQAAPYGAASAALLASAQNATVASAGAPSALPPASPSPPPAVAPVPTTLPPTKTNATRPLPPPDKDRDGVPDTIDKCPTKAETRNGYRDTDGCPDVITTTRVS